MPRLIAILAALMLMGSLPVNAQPQPTQRGPSNNAVNSSD
jgi:hypothetical protein